MGVAAMCGTSQCSPSTESLRADSNESLAAVALELMRYLLPKDGAAGLSREEQFTLYYQCWQAARGTGPAEILRITDKSR